MNLPFMYQRTVSLADDSLIKMSIHRPQFFGMGMRGKSVFWQRVGALFSARLCWTTRSYAPSFAKVD